MEGLRKYLRIALPLLFISYLGCLIAFTHVHIVNGVTIVHSHPYQKNDDGTPKKEHNYAEFQLLHQLSTIQVGCAAFAQVLIAAFIHLSGLSGSPSSRPGEGFASCATICLF